MLTRKQLLENVWGWEYAGQSQVLETYVSYLRRKLDPLGPPLIHTQRGVGYTLRADEGRQAGRSDHAGQGREAGQGDHAGQDRRAGPGNRAGESQRPAGPG
jgi:two-component system OmpR family response regulator